MRLEEHPVCVGTQQPNVRYRTQMNAKELKIANSIITVPFSVLKCKVFCSEQVLKITSGSIWHVYVYAQSCLLIIFQHQPRLSCSTFDWVLNSQSELTECCSCTTSQSSLLFPIHKKIIPTLTCSIALSQSALFPLNKTETAEEYRPCANG